MKSYLFIFSILFSSLILTTSCETEAKKKERLARQESIELIKQQKEEQERKEREIYNKFSNNSLSTGSTPYSYCFGKNKSCNHYGCSQIKVRAPLNNDVLVTIKKDGKVFRHAYIQASSRYTFEVPNGTYQTFFYYGKGWYPEKMMKKTTCGILKGGFLTDEYFGKDMPQNLHNNILEYELILQRNGNFKTRPSSKDEAF
jgi:hypothetical protein